MYHCRKLTHKIDKIHESALRIVYHKCTFKYFLIKKDKTLLQLTKETSRNQPL